MVKGSPCVTFETLYWPNKCVDILSENLYKDCSVWVLRWMFFERLFYKGGSFVRKLVRVILVFTLGGVMPRRYEEQLQKRGRHRYRRNGIFEGFWLFLLYEGYQNNLSMMVIVSGGWAMLLCQPWSDKWCPKSKENAVFGPILTITSCLIVLNSTEKDEREDDIMDRDLL